MDRGAWLVAASAVVALATALLLRKRIAPVMVSAVLAVAGAGIGWGAMLLQEDPSPGEFAVAVAVLAFLVPAHARVVLGPFGPPRTPPADRTRG